jgi:hypothetical protein
VSEVTWPGLGSKLDYLFVSGPVVSRGGGEGEVYNSEVEAVADGLPKREGLAVPGLSGQASDHFAVFADVPMTGLPGLELRAEREWVNEGEVIGFEVGLGRVWAEPVAVTVRSWRDGRVVVPETVVIPAGADECAGGDGSAVAGRVGGAPGGDGGGECARVEAGIGAGDGEE